MVGPDDRLPYTAILKTLEGSRRWDPDRVDLGGQLFGIVSSDIDKEPRRSVYASLPRALKIPSDMQPSKRWRRETEHALGRSALPSDEAPMASVWTLAMTALREVANDERDVLRILDVYASWRIQ